PTSRPFVSCKRLTDSSTSGKFTKRAVFRTTPRRKATKIPSSTISERPKSSAVTTTFTVELSTSLIGPPLVSHPLRQAVACWIAVVLGNQHLKTEIPVTRVHHRHPLFQGV